MCIALKFLVLTLICAQDSRFQFKQPTFQFVCVGFFSLCVCLGCVPICVQVPTQGSMLIASFHLCANSLGF